MARLVSVLFHYRAYATAALNVLLASLEELPDPPRMVLAQGKQRLVEALQEELAAGRRALVLWSFYSPDLEPCARELAWVRARVDDPRVTHIAGGPHASAEPLSTLRAGFDFAAQGEGEALVRELARRHERGEDLAACRGIARLSPEGELLANGQAERVELDDYPAVAYRSKRFHALEITRGCIYACGFCQTPFLFKARFRHRSVMEIRRAVRCMAAAGCGYVRFLSPTSLSYGSGNESVELGAVEELLRGVREELGAGGRIYFGTFPSELRPEHVTPEALALLRRMVDNRQLVIGGQSGSERVLAATHRGHDVEAVRRAVRVSLKCGFTPNVDFLLGLPGESEAEMETTMAFARELAQAGARIHAHAFMPLPGTPLKAADAGELPARIRAQLEQLSSSGKAYGQWRAQEQFAAGLAARKRG